MPLPNHAHPSVYLERVCGGEDRIERIDAPLACELKRRYALALEVIGNRLRGPIAGAVMLEVDYPDGSFRGGGVGLVVRRHTVGQTGTNHMCRMNILRLIAISVENDPHRDSTNALQTVA